MVQKVPASGLENAGGNFKNLIINGDFRIFQRASGSTAIGNGTYSTADRYKTHFSNEGAGTTQQYTMTDADRATTGHSFAWQWDVGTADGTIGSGQTCYFRQFIEAQNCSGLAYGSSAAKTLTLSFWVKSAKTGTYCCSVVKPDSTAYYLPLEYTISSADTWEFKALEISPTAGSTSLITGSGGDIAQDNGQGLILYWWLAAGSEFHGTNNTWTTNSSHLATSNQVNWLDSTSNNFYITGIQLEVGDSASDFEHLPFDVQLQRCFRYFQKIQMSSNSVINGMAYGSTSIYTGVPFPDGTMRTSPTVTLPTAGKSSGNVSFVTAVSAYPTTVGTNTVDIVTPTMFRIIGASYSANFAAGYAVGFYSNGTNNITMNAEL